MGKEDMLPLDEDKLNTVLKNPLLSFSYIGNTIFWMFPKYWIDIEKYEKYLALWKSETIMSEHKKELQEIIDYCSSNKKNLYVLVFPEFTSIEFSNTLYVDEICNFFAFQGVRVLNVSKITESTLPNLLITSRLDSHPSKVAHRLVGDALAKIINEENNFSKTK